MKRQAIITRFVAAVGALLTLNGCGGEVFTNPFLLREAFLTEGELVKRIAEFGIDSNTLLGKAIEEYVQYAWSIWIKTGK